MKDFAESLPNGFGHKIELSGSNLSDGHRQRLAIARARNKDAAIYILDDRRSGLPDRIQAAGKAWADSQGQDSDCSDPACHPSLLHRPS